MAAGHCNRSLAQKLQPLQSTHQPKGHNLKVGDLIFSADSTLPITTKPGKEKGFVAKLFKNEKDEWVAQCEPKKIDGPGLWCIIPAQPEKGQYIIIKKIAPTLVLGQLFKNEQSAEKNQKEATPADDLQARIAALKARFKPKSLD